MSGERLPRPLERTVRRPLFKIEDLAFAYECAADFLDMEEWEENDGGAQVAAYKEAARRIRKRAEVLYRNKTPNA